jgi:hypothetical protein
MNEKMADDNKIYVGIATDNTDFEKGLKDAEKATDDFVKKVSGKKVKSEDTAIGGILSDAVELSDRLDEAEGGMGMLQTVVESLGQAATSAGGDITAMMTSMGSMAAVAALVLIISHWEEINLLVEGHLRALKELDRLMERIHARLSIIETEVDLYESEARLLKEQGFSLDAIKKKHLDILTAKQTQLTLDLTALKQQKERLKSAYLEESWLDRIMKKMAKLQGLPMPAPSESSIKRVQELNKEINRIQTSINETEILIRKISKGEFGAYKNDPESEEAYDRVSAIIGFNAETFLIWNKRTKRAFENIKKEFGEAAKGGFEETFDPDEMKAIGTEYVEVVNELGEQLSEALKAFLIDETVSFGEMIGNLFGNPEDVRSSGAKMLDALGGILKTFGSLIIASAIAGEAFAAAMDNLFNVGGWAVALVAGVALVAAGTAVSNYADSLSGGGGSGGSIGTVSSSPNYNSPQFSNIPDEQSNDIKFEIEGTKLIGVIRNTNIRNRSLGGSIKLA